MDMSKKGTSIRKQKRDDSRTIKESKQKKATYHGVRMRSWGRWVSEIREPKKTTRIWLGTFPTAIMAAQAHDVAELAIKGRSAQLNFPELAPLLPRPASNLPKDIQAAATEAATFVQASMYMEVESSMSQSPIHTTTSSPCSTLSDDTQELINFQSVDDDEAVFGLLPDLSLDSRNLNDFLSWPEEPFFWDQRTW
ncbi:hypothetical protein ACHQM5_020902 [Ranunculus cassubicifolius]